MLNAYERERQTSRVATWRSQVAAVFSPRPAGSGVFAAQIAAWRHVVDASRTPLPSIGLQCHELRVNDAQKTWRIISRIDPDAIVICEVFEKKTPRTPPSVIAVCQQRLRRYDADVA